MQSPSSNRPVRMSATSPAIDLKHLLTTVRRKDALLTSSVRNLAIFNIVAALMLLLLMQLALQRSVFLEFQPYATTAFAAFLSGSLIPAIVYGMRLSGVILELIGSTSAFKLNIPVLASLLFGIGSFVTGSVFVYQGLSVLPATLF